MKKWVLTAYNVGREIQVKRLARDYTGRRLYLPWEEPFTLIFKGVKVMVFSFGSFVTVNGKREVDREFAKFLMKYVEKPMEVRSESYMVIEAEGREEYRKLLEQYGAEGGRTIAVAEEACIVYGYPVTDDLLKVVAFTLAQSLALSRIEAEIDEAMERARDLLDKFERGSFLLTVKPAVRELTRVLKRRFELLSDIMVLEKPRIAWEVPELDMLYEELRDVYEIDDRFLAVDKAMDDLLEMGSMISDLALAYRESLLEAMIILLIVVELLVSIIQHLFG